MMQSESQSQCSQKSTRIFKKKKKCTLDAAATATAAAAATARASERASLALYNAQRPLSHYVYSIIITNHTHSHTHSKCIKNEATQGEARKWCAP